MGAVLCKDEGASTPDGKLLDNIGGEKAKGGAAWHAVADGPEGRLSEGAEMPSSPSDSSPAQDRSTPPVEATQDPKEAMHDATAGIAASEGRAADTADDDVEPEPTEPETWAEADDHLDAPVDAESDKELQSPTWIANHVEDAAFFSPLSQTSTIAEPAPASGPPVSEEVQVMRWITALTGHDLEGVVSDDRSLEDELRSGRILCELINAIRPGTVSRIETVDAPFRHRENIARFLDGARDLGLAETELFETRDLYDGGSKDRVCRCLFALGRACFHVEGYSGPCLGKPRRAKLGAYQHSSHYVSTNNGLWGTASGAHRPTAGTDAKMKPVSATGFPAQG